MDFGFYDSDGGDDKDKYDNTEDNDDYKIECTVQIEAKVEEPILMNNSEKSQSEATIVSKKVENHDKTYKCKLCHFKTYNKSELSSHMKDDHDKSTFHCPTCDFQTFYTNSLKLHISSIHDGTTFQCSYCHLKFSVKGNLARHEATVHLSKNLICSLCNYETAWKKQYQSHIKQHNSVFET